MTLGNKRFLMGERENLKSKGHRKTSNNEKRQALSLSRKAYSVLLDVLNTSNKTKVVLTWKTKNVYR